MSVKQVLSGHTSFETAYLVESYPYGRLRCRIWFWVEYNENKGFRFCSRTENPKSGDMNAPKKSTYSKLAGVMYLDENGHVQFSGIYEYMSANQVLDFILDFDYSDDSRLLKAWTGAKYRLAKKILESGFHLYAINGVSQPLTDADKVRLDTEMKLWNQANLRLQGL